MGRSVKDLGKKFDVLRSYPDCAAQLRILRCWQDQEIAEKLGVAAGTWSKMKAGKLDLDVGHGALLLEICGISHVSGDVFYKPFAEFRRILEPVGLAGRLRLGRLFPLWERRREQGLSILRPRNEEKTITRGITSGTNESLTLRIGELIKLEIDRPSGGFLILFEVGPKKIELTIPSLHRRDIALRRGKTVLPNREQYFNVGGPSGDYWLIAAVTDDRPSLPTWALPDRFSSDHPALVLNEEEQGKLVEVLEGSLHLEVFALPYEVTRSNLA